MRSNKPLILKNFLNPELHFACSKDEFIRPTMMHIHFTGGYMYATEGHILVKASIKKFTLDFTDEEIKILEGKAINGGHWKSITSHVIIKITEEGIVSDHWDQKIIYKWARNMKAPNFEALMSPIEDKPDTLLEMAVKGFSFQPLKLQILLKAMPKVKDVGGIVMKQAEYGKPILVKSEDYTLEELTGLLMPTLSSTAQEAHKKL